MKSYLVITEDRATGEIEVRAKLRQKERVELACIRHFIVERITQVLDPNVKKVTFKFA